MAPSKEDDVYATGPIAAVLADSVGLVLVLRSGDPVLCRRRRVHVVRDATPAADPDHRQLIRSLSGFFVCFFCCS